MTELPNRLHRILDQGAANGADRVAFVDEAGDNWTFQDLIDASAGVADDLSALGVRPGDRLMIVCENSIAAIVLLYAASRIDAWAVMTNARLSAREIDAIKEDCAPRRTVYVHGTSADAGGHGRRTGARDHEFHRIGSVLISDLDETCSVEPVSPDPAKQVAVLIYTTGTTGRPKGVMLSHANLVFVASQGKRTGRMLPEDVSLCLMPISHSYGLTTMQGMLFAGGRQHLMARFSVSGVAQLILAQTLTVLMAVPAVYSRLINFAKTQDRRLVPNRLRYLYTGTAPLDLTLRRHSEDVLGVVMQNGYGLTETSPTISRSGFALGSDETHIGVPIPGVEVRIAAPGTGEPVAAGTPGELLVRGPNVMVGYYRRPDLTRAVIDADGFFATGDIARQAEDGALHLEGRAKELIIRSGFNVYPQEIEAELNAHPGVFASAVVGRDVENDEEIIAFVELAPGQPVTARALAEFIAPRLTPYKRPQLIVILDALPLSPNAKILKHELKARAAKLPMTAVQ